VSVQMRHALTDAIVHRDKGAVGFERRLDRATETLDVLEIRLDQMCRQIAECLVVCFWYQETMTRENGSVVEEGQRYLVFKYQPRRHLAGDNLAECT